MSLRQDTKLGFVILSHDNNPMLVRLLSKLNQLYDNPPIVIHHDFSQSPLPLTDKQLTKNVTILKPHVKTRWAHISVVHAFLSSLEELYHKYSPDWFSLISASCYPVAPGSSVLTELATTNYDAFIGYAMVYPEIAYPDASSMQTLGEFLLSPALPTYTSDVGTWLESCYQRYVATERSGTLFSADFGCFAGDHWFTANEKSAAILISSRRKHFDLFYHYTNVAVPEESYYQTVLCNNTELNICPNNRRFASWYTDGAHPHELTLSDMTAILASRCHFARKVSCKTSSALLDALDCLHVPPSADPTPEPACHT